MAHQANHIDVAAAVLHWARETGGYSTRLAAKRANVSESQFIAWETGPQPALLTSSQLEELADYFKRPTAALLLREPPEQPPFPRDFRKLAKKGATFSPALRLAIRRARRLQRVANELLASEAAEVGHSARLPKVSVSQDAEVIAKKLRAESQVAASQQIRWHDPRKAFRAWRAYLEQAGLLVFQARFDRNEAQAFSISDSDPAVVVVSSKDFPSARCFSLFHEYGHLLLGRMGICLPSNRNANDFVSTDDLNRTETWCDRFAEAFLVPQDDLRRAAEFKSTAQKDTLPTAVGRLADMFSVSRHVILFRLYHLDRIPHSLFWQQLSSLRSTLGESEQLIPEAMDPDDLLTPRRPGFLPPHRRTIQERGPRFTHLVLQGLDREKLTGNEVFDYLGIRLKHLESLRKEIGS